MKLFLTILLAILVVTTILNPTEVIENESKVLSGEPRLELDAIEHYQVYKRDQDWVPYYDFTVTNEYKKESKSIAQNFKEITMQGYNF